MKTIITKAIVLSRTNFAEADRILTLLTSDNGKVRVIAKGVRRERSKLAGGVELFSISEVSFINGRGEISTLISSRLQKHYGHIVKDVERTMLAFELLRIINKTTEDTVGEEYFSLLSEALEVLNNNKIDYNLISLWFSLKLLQISGHGPNFKKDSNNSELFVDSNYNFDNKTMAFDLSPHGQYDSGHIKLLRLALANSPALLARLQGTEQCLDDVHQLAVSMRKYHLHV